MENPFEVIMGKLLAIENRLISIERKIENKKNDESSFEVMTLNQLCNYLELSKSHIYKLTSRQEIPHSKRNGKKLYFDKYDIDKWILKNKIDTNDEINKMAIDYCLKNKFKL